jgi:hypothetical protein
MTEQHRPAMNLAKFLLGQNWHRLTEIDLQLRSVLQKHLPNKFNTLNVAGAGGYSASQQTAETP